MKKFSLAMLLLAAVAFSTASPVRAQYYGSQVDLLNFIKVKTDSLATLLSQPTPVTVSWSTMFSGLDLIQGTTSNALFCSSRRTYPIAAGMPVDGAKAILLEFSWLRWAGGGFSVEPIWAASANDTGSFSYGNLNNAYSWCDSIQMDDSTGTLMTGYAANHPSRDNGTATLLLPVETGAGYLFLRIRPHANASTHIHTLNCVGRKVE